MGRVVWETRVERQQKITESQEALGTMDRLAKDLSEAGNNAGLAIKAITAWANANVKKEEK